jgi:hypothetical protein
MNDNRCPNCENDVTDAVMAATMRQLRAGGAGTETMICPHCGEELQVAVTLNVRLERPAYASSR